MKKPIFLFILFTFSASSLFSQRIHTSRPSLVEPAETPGKNTLKIESGFNFNKEEFINRTDLNYLSISDSYTYYSLPALVRYGVTESTELRVGFNYTKANLNNLNKDIFIGYNDVGTLDVNNTDFSASIKQEITTTSDYKLSMMLNYMNMDFNSRVELDSNIHKSSMTANEVDLLVAGNIYFDDFTLKLNYGLLFMVTYDDLDVLHSASLGYHITDELDVFGDLSLIYDLINTNSRERYLSLVTNAGIQYKLNSILSFDFSLGYGFTPISNETHAGAGFVFTL